MIKLYTSPKIEYYDPVNNKLKGTIFLNEKCRAEIVSELSFDVITSNRTYNFKTTGNQENTKVWVNTINNAIKSFK